MAKFLYAIPLSVLFVTLSDQWSLAGFLVGYAVSVVVMFLADDAPGQVNVARLPGQLLWMVVYILQLAWDILLSGFDVARRVLDPRLPINPGELVVSSRDPKARVLMAALSAHAITVTPGEMVEDFEERDGEICMRVHTLDVDDTRQRIEEEQDKRISLLRRVMGDNN